MNQNIPLQEENQKQSEKEMETQKTALERFVESNLLAKYINTVIRSLIILLPILISFYLFRAFFDVDGMFLFPILFLISIFLSIIFQKQLAKINIGFKIQQKYIDFLNKF